MEVKKMQRIATFFFDEGKKHVKEKKLYIVQLSTRQGENNIVGKKGFYLFLAHVSSPRVAKINKKIKYGKI